MPLPSFGFILAVLSDLGAHFRPVRKKNSATEKKIQPFLTLTFESILAEEKICLCLCAFENYTISLIHLELWKIRDRKNTCSALPFFTNFHTFVTFFWPLLSCATEKFTKWHYWLFEVNQVPECQKQEGWKDGGCIAALFFLLHSESEPARRCCIQRRGTWGGSFKEI